MLEEQEEEEKLDESHSMTSFTPFHHTISINEYDNDHQDHHHHHYHGHPGIMVDWKSQPRKESFLSSSLTDEDDDNNNSHGQPLNAYSHDDSVDDDENHKKKKSFLPVSFLYGYYSIVFAMMIPALPALTLHLTHDNSSQAAYLYGIANFVRYIMEFLASPFMGSFADSFGRKPMLILAYVICGVEFVLLWLFPSVGMLFFTRALAGLGDCAQATCYTITTDIALYNKQGVTTLYGFLAGVFGIGYVIGPLLGGLLVEHLSIRICLLVGAIISGVGGLISFFILEESLHYVKKNTTSEEDVQDETSAVHTPRKYLNPFTPIIIHFTNPVIRKLSYPLILSSLTQGVGFIWYIYMEGRYHSSTTLISVYIAFFGVISFIVQGFLIKRLIPHPWNEKKAAMIGYFLQGLQYAGYGVVPRVWGLFVMVLIFSVGLIADPSLKALIVKASLSRQPERSKEIQGNLQGALSGLRTICTALGALFFPAIYSYCLDTNDSLIFLPFLIAGLCFFFAALVLYCQSDHSMPFHTPLDSHSSVDDGKDYSAVNIEESLLGGVDRLDDSDSEESDALDKVALLDPTGQIPINY